VQAPPWHVSVRVYALPSLQLVPFGFAGFEHCPLAGSHVPASWHWSLAVQVTGLPLVHEPAWQVSSCVQAFPSLHVEPSGLAGLLHAPLAVSHVPASWHWSLAVHVTGFAPVQAPAWQVSVCVHALPSLQAVPSSAAGFEH